MKIFNLLILATTGILCACTSMAPKYVRPELPVAQTWPQEVASSAQPIAGEKLVSKLQWKDFFKSPSMQAVIRQVLDNNRDLRVAILNIETARATYHIQRAELIPEIDVRGGQSLQRIPKAAVSAPNSGTNKTSLYSSNLASTSYEIDLFGRIQSLTKQALESYLATEEARKATQIALISEAANAYLQWLADQKVLEVVNSTLNAQKRSYDIIKARNERGISSKLDLMQAQATVDTALANQAIYMRAVTQDKNALMLLMGVGSAGTLITADKLDDVALMNTIPVGLPSQVLIDRPDVQEAEHKLKAQNANIGAARAAFFPTISLTGAYGFSSTKLNNLFSAGASGAWSFAPQVTLPIFAGGRNRANLRIAQAEMKIALANYEKVIQTAFREVSDQLAAHKTLGSQLVAQRRLVKARQSAFDLSAARYKSGIDNYLIVLDSQQSLFAALQTEITVKQQQLVNLVNLYKALGGGLH